MTGTGPLVVRHKSSEDCEPEEASQITSFVVNKWATHRAYLAPKHVLFVFTCVRFQEVSHKSWFVAFLGFLNGLAAQDPQSCKVTRSWGDGGIAYFPGACTTIILYLYHSLLSY